MSKESKAIRLERENNKISEYVTSKVLPCVNPVFKNPIFAGVDTRKLITKVVTLDESEEELKEKERKNTPINTIFPYFDELVQLGVRPELIENAYFKTTDATPYDRDLLNNPSEIDFPNDFSRFRDPKLAMTSLILMLDVLGLPELKEITDPKMEYIARKKLKEYMVETSLRKFIIESGLNFEDPKFDHVKNRIKEDIYLQQTKIYFYGAQILGVLEGQKPDDCAFSSRIDLHDAIAHVLTIPILRTAVFSKEGLSSLKITQLDAAQMVQKFKQDDELSVGLVKEAVGFDFSSGVSFSEKDKRLDDYVILLDLYLKSQIPLLSIDQFA